MRVLPKIDARRKQMLLELGRQGLLKGDLHRSLQASGVKEGIAALKPDRFKPPVDNSQTGMQKWVQAALNVILGTNLKLDGNLGPVTRQALRRFQRQEGLTAHGYADEATLQALELRVGVACPRGGNGHEPIPRLLILQNRNLWMPKPRGQGGKERRDGQDGPGAAGSEADVQAGNEATTAAPQSPEAADPTMQREALGAVRALAFSDGFAQRAHEYLHDAENQADAAALGELRGGMERWLDRQLVAKGDEAPDWLRSVRSQARFEAPSAASLLRRTWWREHVGEGEGL